MVLQICVHDTNIAKTVFHVNYSHYEFLVMSFELTNILATFLKFDE